MKPPPPLTLTGFATTATTYRFRNSHHEWANCTVNDATGELIIVSDWGNWSFMWDPRPHSGLGCATLTHFLGVSRHDGSPRVEMDYFAMKLLGRRGAYRFSAELNVAHFRKRLCEQRLGYPRGGLTREIARYLWDEIGAIAEDVNHTEAASALFVERFVQLDDYGLLSVEPWEEIQTEVSPEYTVLAGTILPALAAACYARAQEPEYQRLAAKFHEESKAREAAYRAAQAPAAAP